jgi:uncharacterized protein YuzE
LSLAGGTRPDTAGKGGAVKVTFDEANDALYVRLDNTPTVESETIEPGVILDYDEREQVVGVEILGVINRIDRNELCSMHFEVA